jgi:hypothetical protein
VDDLEASSPQSPKAHAEIRVAKAQLSDALAVWRELYRLDHNAASPVMDATITVKIVNEGSADALISESATLETKNIRVPLVANSGAPVPLKSQSTATIVFSTRDLDGESRKNWMEFLASQAKDFDLVLSVNHRKIRALGSL